MRARRRRPRRCFTEPTSADDRAGLQPRRARRSGRAHRADRHGENNKVSVGDGASRRRRTLRPAPARARVRARQDRRRRARSLSAAPYSRAARAMDAPIRPTPRMAMRSKIMAIRRARKSRARGRYRAQSAMSAAARGSSRATKPSTRNKHARLGARNLLACRAGFIQRALQAVVGIEGDQQSRRRRRPLRLRRGEHSSFRLFGPAQQRQTGDDDASRGSGARSAPATTRRRRARPATASPRRSVRVFGSLLQRRLRFANMP